MTRAPRPADLLADRFCRPRRIGIFGHRGVGKTTLVTVLYREAVGGRLPGLRLAAADARTANYLSDKILQLEAGQPLPGTLAETDLRFHLYHGERRQELLLRDYQGEHVELGRDEPILEFLRDCDALWLCFDAATLADPANRLRRQQEVEQLLEAYLAAEPQRTLDRPVALVLTKGDLLEEGSGVRGQGSVESTEPWREAFAMTRHTLRSHCPVNGVFEVRCLTRASRGLTPPARPESFALAPQGLAEPVAWLAGALQGQDEQRLDQLWKMARGDVRLLTRCVACYARRYPESPSNAVYRQRLRELRRRQLRVRLYGVAAAAASLFAAAWTYDALGYQRAAQFEEQHEPAAARENWIAYAGWHPTRHLLWPGATRAEEERLHRLDEAARQHRRDDLLADLRRRARQPDGDVEQAWQQFHRLRAEFPDTPVPDDLLELDRRVEQERRDLLIRRDQQAYDELVIAEHKTEDLPEQVSLAERFLNDHPGSPHESEVRGRRDAYLLRMEEADVETARAYSARNPFNFHTRREQYRHYLDRHPDGRFASEAKTALQTIEADWDKHDFRTVRDHFLSHPADISELVTRCRTYLAVHPSGRFRDKATELLRWSEKVTAPHEYRVTLVDGHFDRSVAHFFSRGPKLSVELEVNGVRYGPSPITYNEYNPGWNYEFPRPVRWKLGDKVIIRVSEHSWRSGVVATRESDDGDPLALRLLTGDLGIDKHRVTFQCPDFALPSLPQIE